MIYAIHTAVRGRGRYHVDALYRSDALKQYLERHLSKQRTINQVSASSLTGNVLVKFAPESSHDDIAAAIATVVEQYQQSEHPSHDSSSVRTPRPRQSCTSRDPQEGDEQPVKAWHKMRIESVLKEFNTDKEGGLSTELVEALRDRYGSNRLSETDTRSDLTIILEQFNSLPVALLSAAAVLSIVTGGLADAMTIMGVVGVNAIIGYVTESQSEQIIHSLRDGDRPSALVFRDGDRIEVESDEIVPGDIVVLRSGNQVPADARLIATDMLSVDESALTGESIPVDKTSEVLQGDTIPLAERTNMVYKGTLVTGGSGLGVVVATAQFTEMGKIQTMVGEAADQGTPLQRQLDETGSQLVAIGSGVCALVFGIGLLRGYGFLQMLKTAISLAVASVPEGLPTIATTILALGIRDMRKQNILVRSLNAVEALGSVQTICLDKTGTITQNRMVVKQVHIALGEVQIGDRQFISHDDEPIQLQDCKELLILIQVGVLCNESEVHRQDDGTYDISGSSTENALVELAIAAEIDVADLHHQYPRQDTLPRSENRNVMTTVHDMPGGPLFVAVKGSPDEVLEKCAFRMKDGDVMPLTDDDRQAIILANERMAGQALRVLGFAYTHLDSSDDHPETDLIWLGLTGMADPIREGVAELIADFHRAGIDTVMITGDQSPTAYAIGKQLHLSRDRNLEILDASNLAALDPEKLKALSDKVDIFARISPADKLQIVQALQNAGKIVAMTGDGINDTPALKAANVGVAMGAGGTSVVHEVADVVIGDDDLQTMIDAVSRGRTIYSNIRKSVHFLLATNMSEIMVATVATAAGLGEPLNAMQLLWLNLVTDIFPGLALALEPPEPDVLAHPPRDPDTPIIQPDDYQRIIAESAVISVSALAAYGYGLLRYGISQRSSTVIFMSLTIGQVLHTLSCRSQTQSFLGGNSLPRNPYVEWAIAGSLTLQILPLVVPPLRGLLKLEPIDPIDAAVIATFALLPLVVNESSKALQVNQPSELQGA
ncbi:MAG: HAD-IC family P-type ATPase [Elainellaceae cyanobacterium]